MKQNLYFLGTTLISGLASVGLAVQPIQAANISVTGTNGNWLIGEFDFVPADENSFGIDSFSIDTVVIAEAATDLGLFDIQLELTDFTPNSTVPLAIGKYILNWSNATWTGFNIGIGTGLGSGYTPLDPSSGFEIITQTLDGLPTPLDVAFFSFDGEFGFAQNSLSGNNLSFFNGTVIPTTPDGDELSNVTVPLFVLNVPTDANGNAIFTIRQNAVPEPLTIVGVGTALGFGSFFKRQQGKNPKKNKTKTIA
ncbi:hypothetical protein PCC7424_4757 [Gloeothece citriformis PCC 7424]|uniref:PEP-CTERM protein-sorting domain-containing protein n=1 Tax=Gloeothece citriformis (strain PCC 7424) TaxID=65393 RepID=B7KCZ5_GLOC7|nr:PEP-CTERM sorting domain-containing protein [Gloeothece citriformis]ACK73116.1 hypothetical protein PCC7424_4757 [Gloeothece citriformis PCC 7424]